jgi:iron complex outermembrane receptor protein
MRIPSTLATLALAATAATPAALRAQTAPAAAAPAASAASAPAGQVLEPVVVTATRTRTSAFDAPAAISAIGRDAIEAAGSETNLSEALVRVPGIAALNRQNYAQDLQLSIRGFGARSTFGIRGVRLLVDGIPATMPDGQGQASNVALGSAGRIEVLRGPLAQLWGNAAGGVVQVFTADEPARPTVSATVAHGRFGLWRESLGFAGRLGDADGLTLDLSRFRTDGPRPHASAERWQGNALWRRAWSPTVRTTTVLNVLDQPRAEDPLGLTRAQFEADPRQTAAIALQQDARKTVRQNQLGQLLEWDVDPRTTVSARAHVGTRDLDNALALPPAAQTAPTSSGGIVSFARTYAGGGLQVAHRVPLDEGRSLRLVAGIEGDRLREDRQGFVNTAGAQGALKRDELNRASNRDAVVQASWDVATDWTLLAGARRTSVEFRSADRYVAAGNPDDSGSVSYRATNPVAGVAWRPSGQWNLYANWGRGFETPTFTELSYRDGASGLNTGLDASRSRHLEAGVKWRDGTGRRRVEAALFDVRTNDEIVVQSNSGGRSVFTNAGRTSRRGAEVAFAGRFLGDSLQATASATVLEARFRDAFTSGTGAAAVPVAAGNRLPGTPRAQAFGELAWTPPLDWARRIGLVGAVEVVHTGRIAVDDANSDTAAASTLWNLRLGFAQGDPLRGWRFAQLVRLDNVFDRTYAGSVIVNESNRRFFEPGLPRAWLAKLTAAYAFD